jgi:drug/metabolite transporter (DMT)-like permease
MTDIEISVLVLLANGVFILISALCIAATLQDVMAEKGWHSARPVLIWLGWCLVTWLGGFILLVLANAHTHVPGKILVIRMMVLAYLLLGSALFAYLLKRLRNRDSPGAG